jgi:hypothetical protein
MPQPSIPFTRPNPHPARRALTVVSALVPVLVDLLLGLVPVVRDLIRPHVELVAENALLRRQLIVVRRQVPRAKVTHADRWWMVLVARLTQSWRNALLLVQPATLLRWYRALHRRWWAWKSSPKRTAQPTIATETAALIRQMATANRL